MQKKRTRRAARDIVRAYRCWVGACMNSYGSEGALKTHFKQKHAHAGPAVPVDDSASTYEASRGLLMLVSNRPTTPTSKQMSPNPSSSSSPPASTKSRSGAEIVYHDVEINDFIDTKRDPVKRSNPIGSPPSDDKPGHERCSPPHSSSVALPPVSMLYRHSGSCTNQSPLNQLHYQPQQQQPQQHQPAMQRLPSLTAMLSDPAPIPPVTPCINFQDRFRSTSQSSLHNCGAQYTSLHINWRPV